MLEIGGLFSGYGAIDIVRDCSFTVRPREVVGILGHNGMGKTTLLRTIMGYLPAKRGEIVYAGEKITSLSVHRRVRRGISLMPQGREIFPNLTARENIRMGLVMRRRDTPAAIDALVEQIPRIGRLLDRVGGTMSGGEQQLLALARCLATEPRLILLDEPTEGIQPSILDELVETFLRIRQSKEVTILLVEQNLEFVSALADRILVIQKGHISQELERSTLSDTHMVGELLGFGDANVN